MNCQVVNQEKLHTLKSNWSMLRTTWRKVMHTKSMSFEEATLTLATGRLREGRCIQLKGQSEQWNTAGVLCCVVASGNLVKWRNHEYVKSQHKIGSGLSLSVNLTMARNMLVKNYLQKIKLIVIDWYLTENLWGGLKTRVHARRPWMLTLFLLTHKQNYFL